MAFQATAPLVLPDGAAAAEFFRSIGFKVTSGTNEGSYEIERNRDRAHLTLTESASKAGVKQVIYLSLSWKYAFRQALPEDLVDSLPISKPEAWNYVSNLDGSLQMRGGIALDPQVRKVDVVKAIDGLWDARKIIDKEVVRPFRGVDWILNRPIPDAPLDEQRIVHNLSQSDAFYLFKNWGWQSHKSYGGSGSMWYVLGDVEGQDTWIAGPLQGPKGVVKGFRLSADPPLPAGDAVKWVADRQSGLGSKKLFLTFEVQNGNTKPVGVSFEDRVELGDGVTLAELRTRVLDFARYAKTLSTTPR